jgi:hypothetical protein
MQLCLAHLIIVETNVIHLHLAWSGGGNEVRIGNARKESANGNIDKDKEGSMKCRARLNVKPPNQIAVHKGGHILGSPIHSVGVKAIVKVKTSVKVFGTTAGMVSLDAPPVGSRSDPVVDQTCRNGILASKL